MTWDDVAALAIRAFPGSEVSTSYGTPAVKVRKKLLTRYRPDDDSLVLFEVPQEERAMLIEADPARFHTTPHYRDYPMVLLRLGPADPRTVENFLERRWQVIAPKGAQHLRQAGRAG